MEIAVRRVLVTLAFLVLISLIIHPSTAHIIQSEAELVTYVHSYGKYIPRWNNVYTYGDKINVYVSAHVDNPTRAVALDFVYVVTDPNGYVVDAGEKPIRTLSYQDKFFIIFGIDVKKSWLEGKYKLDIYVYDVLNTTATFINYAKLPRTVPYTGNSGVGISTVNRRDAPRIHKEMEFFVSDSISPPKDQLLVYDSYLKAKELPQGANNSLHLSVLNTIGCEGSGSLELVIDGKPVETKKVSLKAYEEADVNFEIPALKPGTHTIEVVPKSDNIQLIKVLPMFIEPLVFKGEIQVGEIYNGSVVYSPNNYVLGSIGISALSSKLSIKLNEKSARKAMKMFTNIIAYLWSKHKGKGVIKVGIYEGSDDRAKEVLPELIEMIRRESNAPINYLGVLKKNEISKASILFYVNDKVDVKDMEEFFKKGGFLIVDNTDYWSNLKNKLEEELEFMKGWRGFRTEDIYGTYYNLYINKVVTITTKKETKLPPEFSFSNLNVDKFIVNVGEPVNVSFIAVNKGKEGGKEVKVLINNKVVFEKKIELGVGEERKISFQYTPKEEGSYKVTIEGAKLSKLFFAKEKAEKKETPIATPKEVRRGGAMVIGSAVLLAVLVIIRLFIRE